MLSRMVRKSQVSPASGVLSMATLRGIAVTTGTKDSRDAILRLARSYLQSRNVTDDIDQLKKVAMNDVFRLLERLSQQVNRMELRRLYDLLTELAVVRENHLLAQKASHEARLIKAIQHTGRLGKFVSLVLDETT